MKVVVVDVMVILMVMVNVMIMSVLIDGDKCDREWLLIKATMVVIMIIMVTLMVKEMVIMMVILMVVFMSVLVDGDGINHKECKLVVSKTSRS